MATMQVSQGLEQRLAQMLVPTITQIARDVEDGARDAAPAEKIWQSQGDALVRPTHAHAHGQTVPDNLRFTLEVPEYDQRHSGAGAREMARAPRDRSLTDGNFYECRCNLGHNPDGVASTIHALPAHAAGTRVSAEVICTHHLAKPAEFGTAEDEGARFMAKGIRAAARHLG